MGVHDPAARRKGKRSSKERGVWVYVTEADLNAMGFETKGDAPVPFYRTWTRRKTILVQFYAEA